MVGVGLLKPKTISVRFYDMFIDASVYILDAKEHCNQLYLFHLKAFFFSFLSFHIYVLINLAQEGPFANDLSTTLHDKCFHGDAKMLLVSRRCSF